MATRTLHSTESSPTSFSKGVRSPAKICHANDVTGVILLDSRVWHKGQGRLVVVRYDYATKIQRHVVRLREEVTCRTIRP
jgi:hypothetical protein